MQHKYLIVPAVTAFCVGVSFNQVKPAAMVSRMKRRHQIRAFVLREDPMALNSSQSNVRFFVSLLIVGDEFFSLVSTTKTASRRAD